MRIRFSLLTALPALSTPLQAAQDVAVASPTMGMLKMVLGLLVVLAVMYGLSWFIKRLGLTQPHATSIAKVVGNVSVGARERVVVVQIADQWLVVGVAPGQVNAITAMPAQPEAPAASTNAAQNPAWLAAAQKFLKPLQQAQAARAQNTKPQGEH